MSLMKGLISVAVVAGIGFLVCLLGGISIDGCSKSRDAEIEKEVSDVAARTDAAAADAAVALEQANAAATAAAAGKGGTAGKPGLACWDVDANGACDLDEEDTNYDKECSVLDCRGDVGPKGDRGKTGFALVTIGGKNGRDGKDCTTGGTCEFYSVCCTDDGKPTVTATPTSTAPAKDKAKKKAKKNKQQRPATVEAEGSVVNYNYNYNEGDGKRPAIKVGNIKNEGVLNLNIN